MSFRVDTKVKDQAKQFISDLGLDMTTAIHVFLRQVVRRRGFPFELMTEDSTERVVREARQGINMRGPFSSIDALMSDLNAS